VRLLKRKSLSLHWELMFTRSLFQTRDMEAQHHLLNAWPIWWTGAHPQHRAGSPGPDLRRQPEKGPCPAGSGTVVGKIVLEGFN
jgi:hypothetical protein